MFMFMFVFVSVSCAAAGSAAGGANARAAASTLLEQARQWESAGDFARAVECYMRLLTQAAQMGDAQLVERAATKACSCSCSCSCTCSCSCHSYNVHTLLSVMIYV